MQRACSFVSYDRRCFNQRNVNEGMSFFEKNAFLDVSERSKPTKYIIPNKKILARNLKSEKITKEMIQEAKGIVEFDDKIPNKLVSRVKAKTRLSTPQHMCYLNQNETIPSMKQRRILRELHYASLVMDEKNVDYYDSDLVFFSTNLEIWQVFMKAPQDGPYIGKWFHLIATFPTAYPIEPPLIRFVSIPYNLNISSEGRICFDNLEKGYIPSFHVIDILQSIKTVLLTPILETPIQIEILDTFLYDRTKYDRLAKESANKVGRDDYKDFFPLNTVIADKVGIEFKLVFDEKDIIPTYMKSQISGRVFKWPD